MKIPAGPIIAVVVTVVLVVLAELALGWLAPFPDPYLADKRIARYVPSAHVPNVEYRIQIEEGLPGFDPVHPGRVNVFTTNNYGFRGDELEIPKPADEVRVFVVGGSTTESLALDDSQDMSRVLQGLLQAGEVERAGTRVWKVYNAGKSGDRSYDHLAMVSQRIVHLQPDVVVVFAGINDLLAGMFQVDYTHMQPMELTRDRTLRLLASESQLFRRAHAVARRFLRQSTTDVQQTIAFQTNYADKAALQRSYREVDDEPITNVAAYERNLHSIVAVARAAGAEVVLMTQASTWASDDDTDARYWHWMRLRRARTYAEAPMDSALEAYNDAMRRIAADDGNGGAPGLLDLPALLPKTLQYFHDDVHFNVEGARAAAVALQPLIDQVVGRRQAPETRAASPR
jgi:lysophospholipase L1-like esterase